MKLLIKLLTLMIAFAIPTISLAQSSVEFAWTQPDSTGGTEQPDGTICCKSAIPDGDLEKYEIFLATPTDTLLWGSVQAPTSIAEDATAIVPLELYVPSSIAVRAIDIRGNVGPLSRFSEPFTVDPGPPGVATQPVPIRVYFGG